MEPAEDTEGDRMDPQRDTEVYNSRGGGDTKQSKYAAGRQSQSNYHSIECLINNEYSVSCQHDGNGEVYLPFKFIRKYFEVIRTFPS